MRRSYIKRMPLNIFNLLLLITLVFFSQNSLSENTTQQNPNTQDNTEIEKLKEKLNRTNKNLATQKKEKAALEARLQKMESMIQQLIEQNTATDEKLEGLQKKPPK